MKTKYDLVFIMKRAHEMRRLYSCTMKKGLLMAWAEAKGTVPTPPVGYFVEAD